MFKGDLISFLLTRHGFLHHFPMEPTVVCLSLNKFGSCLSTLDFNPYILLKAKQKEIILL